MVIHSFMFIGANLLFYLFTTSLALDSVRQHQSLSEDRTMISREGSFELGFFTPGSYLGIWYKNIPNKSVVWWTSSPKQAQNPLVQILDSGNLVVRDEENAVAGSYFWQSFDYPSDTLLPKMKLGWDLKTGLKRGLSSWRNPEDPCPGNFTYGMELGPRTYPEEYIRNGNTKYYRTGPWNGLRFSGVPEQKANDFLGFNFVYNDDEVYYAYTIEVNFMITRIVLNPTTGKRERSSWFVQNNAWMVNSSLPEDKCDDYGLCGANSNCSIIGQNPIYKMKKPRGNGKMKATVIAVAVIGVVSGMLFLGFCIHGRRKVSLKEKTKRNEMNKSLVWWSISQKQFENPLVQIVDSGNLVIRDEKDYNPEAYLYPSDTLLPDMKMGWDLRTGLKTCLSAWRSPDDPCPGNFTYGIELGPHTYPEAYIRKGNGKYYLTGPWNGLRFSGSPELKPNPLYGFHFVYNDDEVFRERSTWIEAERTWKQYSSVPRDYSDNYGLCRANGKCIIGQNPVCECLQGFKPKSQGNCNIMDWSQGCERNVPLNCQEKHSDGFVKFVGLRLPDITFTWVNKSMILQECRAKFLDNCSCMASENSDISGEGSGCVRWFGGLVDIRGFPEGGRDLHTRMPASELGPCLIL
ncbi:hypothetical protein FEM48_Zijuj01G0213400 [Ziziphus jujuba var. spinosa]|uniref:non-specific serine/threonine protein kinase n=1 Tax=Ziziphus jujuba var. spinosa TaxID=714518 RepID=A0A978W3M3_ZIZJJ|nr:hypothetical protein FEM48_Zijuj01G0213400 [Ziziphus jujuba var. spinosa]